MKTYSQSGRADFSELIKEATTTKKGESSLSGTVRPKINVLSSCHVKTTILYSVEHNRRLFEEYWCPNNIGPH